MVVEAVVLDDGFLLGKKCISLSSLTKYVFQSIMSLSTMTLSIVTLSKATSSITHAKAVIRIKDTQHNNTQQSVKLRCIYAALSFFNIMGSHYALCHNAESHYAGTHYAE